MRVARVYLLYFVAWYFVTLFDLLPLQRVGLVAAEDEVSHDFMLRVEGDSITRTTLSNLI